MLYKKKIVHLKGPGLEFEDLLRKTAEMLRKEMPPKARPVTVPKKHSSAA
jgi:hypothetical protein